MDGRGRAEEAIELDLDDILNTLTNPVSDVTFNSDSIWQAAIEQWSCAGFRQPQACDGGSPV
jgi:hypothetical protein